MFTTLILSFLERYSFELTINDNIDTIIVLSIKANQVLGVMMCFTNIQINTTTTQELHPIMMSLWKTNNFCFKQYAAYIGVKVTFFNMSVLIDTIGMAITPKSV